VSLGRFRFVGLIIECGVLHPVRSTSTVRHRKPSPDGDSYSTPEWMYRALDTEFRFTLDPCPLNTNWVKGRDQDGLELDWDGHRVYCNPPYSNILPWVQKALASKALTVFVLPCRTDTEWFHLLLDHHAEIRFLRKRVDFVSVDKRRVHPAESSIVAIVRGKP
jgi:phage N-6-adenine-methyltransferase